MAEIDIAAEIADAVKNDRRVSAALAEWMRERYSIEISDEVRAEGIERAIQLVVEGANRRADAQDARLDKSDALIAELAKQTAAIRDDTAAMRERMDAADRRHADFERRMDESDKRFAAFQARMDESDKRFAAFEARMDAADKRHEDMVEGFHEQSRRLVARLDRMDQRMAERDDVISEIMNALLNDRRKQNALAERVSLLGGREMEWRLQGEYQSILIQEFDCLFGRLVWLAGDGLARGVDASYGEFGDKLLEARYSGEISQSDFVDIWAADLIAKGALASERSECWFVAEASVAIGRSDVIRAKRRADAVAAFEKAPAEAFVFGQRISDRVEAFAKSQGVKVALAELLEDEEWAEEE